MTPARLVIALAACIAAAAVLSNPAPRAPAAATSRPGMSDEAAYWWNRALSVTARNSTQAVLVSRYQFQRLSPLRSWQDLERLREYVGWADRPEAVAINGAVIDADLSEYDLILLRIPAAAIQAPGRVLRDPLGYAVLDPGRSGRVRLPIVTLVSQVRAPTLAPQLPKGATPVIQAAVAASPAIVTLYGEGFYGNKVRVLTRQGEAALLYVSPNQINAQVPSLDAVAVEVDGLISGWAEVQR